MNLEGHLFFSIRTKSSTLTWTSTDTSAGFPLDFSAHGFMWREGCSDHCDTSWVHTCRLSDEFTDWGFSVCAVRSATLTADRHRSTLQWMLVEGWVGLVQMHFCLGVYGFFFVSFVFFSFLFKTVSQGRKKEKSRVDTHYGWLNWTDLKDRSLLVEEFICQGACRESRKLILSRSLASCVTWGVLPSRKTIYP